MTQQAWPEGLGLSEHPVVPHPARNQALPTVPIPLDGTLSVPLPLASGITIPVPLEMGPTVPIPDFFF